MTQDDGSTVLRLQYGKTSALLVGDSHKRIEALLQNEAPGAYLLKIGHHGSIASSRCNYLEGVAGAVSFYLDGVRVSAQPVPR